MNGIRRGKAVIFNHEKFLETRNLEERKGTAEDVTILKQRLKKLNFEVEVHKDLKIAEIHAQLDKGNI